MTDRNCLGIMVIGLMVVIGTPKLGLCVTDGLSREQLTVGVDLFRI